MNEKDLWNKVTKEKPMESPTKKEWIKETFGNLPSVSLIVGIAILLLSIFLLFSPFWKVGCILFFVSWFPIGIFGTIKLFEAS